MLAQREAVVRDFVSEPFYTPVIGIGSFSASGKRLSAREDAEAVRAACDGEDAVVLSVEKKEKTEAPPRLYDLTSLQREANRILGYTAQQTLGAAQSLYEKKLITYPRTDSRYLTEDMAAGLERLVNIAATRLPFTITSFYVNAGIVIDNSKVSDHHAILPTETGCSGDLDALPTTERNILLMLMSRLVCAVGESHKYEAATVTIECAGHTFTAKGRTVLREGWKAVDAAFRLSLKGVFGDDAEDEEDGGTLPALSDGQAFSSVTASVREGKTSPPKRFTEDTLLAAVESAGAEEMPDEAERKGLGTPATRAGVIEKLIKSGSVERKKKNIIPTGRGANLIAVLPDELKSPLLTAGWEQRLLEVERGGLADSEFMDGITSLVTGIVAAHTAPVPAFASLFAPPPKGAVVGKCPRCGEAVTESGKGFFCSSRTCRFALWKDSRFWSAKGKKLDKKTAVALLKDGRVFLSDLKSEKTGKTYSAAVVLEDDGQKVNYKLDFAKERKAA
jgi:DNA topoisomerase-3